MKHYLALLLVFFWYSPAGAGTAADIVARCDAESSTPAIRKCLQRGLAAKKRELETATEVLAALLERLNGSEPRAMLEDSHAAWKSYRDGDCLFTESVRFQGGSARRGAVTACRIRLTGERIRKIESIAAELR